MAVSDDLVKCLKKNCIRFDCISNSLLYCRYLVFLPIAITVPDLFTCLMPGGTQSTQPRMSNELHAFMECEKIAFMFLLHRGWRRQGHQSGRETVLQQPVLYGRHKPSCLVHFHWIVIRSTVSWLILARTLIHLRSFLGANLTKIRLVIVCSDNGGFVKRRQWSAVEFQPAWHQQPRRSCWYVDSWQQWSVVKSSWPFFRSTSSWYCYFFIHGVKKKQQR